MAAEQRNDYATTNPEPSAQGEENIPPDRHHYPSWMQDGALVGGRFDGEIAPETRHTTNGLHALPLSTNDPNTTANKARRCLMLTRSQFTCSRAWISTLPPRTATCTPS